MNLMSKLQNTNNTYKLQYFFSMYITCSDDKKDECIAECKKVLPNQVDLIDRLRKIVDNINNNLKESFINNVFDVENDMLRMYVIDNLESQIENRTTVIDKINQKELKTVTLDNFELKEDVKNYSTVKNRIVSIDKENKMMIEIDDNDTRFYNYIVEELFGYINEKVVDAES